MSTPSTSTSCRSDSDMPSTSTSNGHQTSEEESDCVYTYKGDARTADLPSSFFQFLPNGSCPHPPSPPQPHSPDMDFLEMDFDPGGGPDELNINNTEVEEEVEEPPPPPPLPPPPPKEMVKSNTMPELRRRRMVLSHSVPLVSSGSGTVTTLFDSCRMSEQESTVDLEVNGAMIWTLEEAKLKKSTGQIATSACGATALIDVMTALGFDEQPSPSTVNSAVGTRIREEEADLPQYLLSRSRAGATAEELVEGMHRVTQGHVQGRFFPANPDLSSSALVKWLLHWICQGAIPVATLNLQKQSPSSTSTPLPDAWHHQMLFGVTREGIFLSNPVQIVSHSVILPQLTSPSVLLVRRQDIVARKRPRTDLRQLARLDPTWNAFNVLGQVSNIFLEEMPIFNGSSVAKRVRSTHVAIPCAYRAGVTLFCQSGSGVAVQMSAADGEIN